MCYLFGSAMLESQWSWSCNVRPFTCFALFFYSLKLFLQFFSIVLSWNLMSSVTLNSLKFSFLCWSCVRFMWSLPLKTIHDGFCSLCCVHCGALQLTASVFVNAIQINRCRFPVIPNTAPVPPDWGSCLNWQCHFREWNIVTCWNQDRKAGNIRRRLLSVGSV